MSLSSCRLPNPLPENSELAEAIRGNPRALGCALVHPTEPEPVEQVRLTAEVWGMPGIKLMPAIHNYNVDDPIVRPVVEAARDYGLIVSIHSGPNNLSSKSDRHGCWLGARNTGDYGSHGFSGRLRGRDIRGKSQQKYFAGNNHIAFPSPLGNGSRRGCTDRGQKSG